MKFTVNIYQLRFDGVDILGYNEPTFLSAGVTQW